ncbi:MAG: serine hydrolase domain-containing protein [Bacteroidota bacterium]
MKAIKILSLFLLFQQTSFAQDIAELVQDGVDQNHFAGAIAAYQVAGEGPVVATAGLSDIDANLPYGPPTINRIASITKTMTAVAVLQLWEQGLIDLDAAIQTYLPDYPNYVEGIITVRHLLQHTSGIDSYRNRETENKEYYPSLATAAEVFQDRPLMHTPGTQETYSSYGYLVLGMIIEAVSGMTYEAYLQEKIWTPAGMQHTGVEYADNRPAGMAEFYYRNRRGKIKKSTPNDLSNRIPGGGVYSTAEDLLRFGHAILDGSLIQDSSLQMMQEQSGVPYEGNPYGMGIFLYGVHPDWGNVVGHSGGQTGVTSQMFIMTEQRTVVVVLSNTALAGPFVGTIAAKVMRLAYLDILEE